MLTTLSTSLVPGAPVARYRTGRRRGNISPVSGSPTRRRRIRSLKACRPGHVGGRCNGSAARSGRSDIERWHPSSTPSGWCSQPEVSTANAQRALGPMAGAHDLINAPRCRVAGHACHRAGVQLNKSPNSVRNRRGASVETAGGAARRVTVARGGDGAARRCRTVPYQPVCHRCGVSIDASA